MSDYILSQEIAYRKLQRMAYEILENNLNEPSIILAGIRDNGILIAKVLERFLRPIYEGKIEIIEIHIDKKNPNNISIPGNHQFAKQVIIVCDDVSNSGRTLLYALMPFLPQYPRKIQSLVLVDRSHKAFPVSPDYVGMHVATALSEKIVVETNEDAVTGARIGTQE